MHDYYVGRKDSFLIDLRNPKEYHTGHIKGAVNVPYEKFEEMQTYDFPKGKILVLYCDGAGQVFRRPGFWREMDIRQNGDRGNEGVQREKSDMRYMRKNQKSTIL